MFHVVLIIPASLNFSPWVFKNSFVVGSLGYPEPMLWLICFFISFIFASLVVFSKI